jgi:hypothetical protein
MLSLTHGMESKRSALNLGTQRSAAYIEDKL